jgi:hypothetical protein
MVSPDARITKGPGENASATALAAELQITPAEPLWAASIAKLGGRLQTNLTELQAATSIQALLDHPDLTLPTNSWLHGASLPGTS